MKIAMFTDAYWPRINGVTVSVDAYSHALLRAGHDVVIVCSSYPESMDKRNSVLPRDSNSALRIIQVPSFPLPISNEDRIAQMHKFFWVSKQLESFCPDILHINSEFVIAEFGFSYAKFHKLPVVYTFHTLWEEYIANYFPVFPVSWLKFIVRRIQKYILKRTDAVIVPTVQIEEMVKKYNVDKDTYLLPTGLEPDFFNHSQFELENFRGIMEQMYPPLRDRRILIYAGRVTKEKNVGFLLNILPAITAKHPEVVLLIIGNGSDLPELQKECERLELTEHCVFTGYLERKDLALAYAMSDIFVFPSLTETQGLVTLEAIKKDIRQVIGE
jgi:glycosyltransferase involved in cell wall biosynthesis